MVVLSLAAVKGGPFEESPPTLAGIFGSKNVALGETEGIQDLQSGLLSASLTGGVTCAC